jgi:peroxin-5
LVESFIRRISAAELAEANLTEVDAWSMLGRIHAMNEKEEKALSAFEEGRKLLEAKPEETNGAGEMLTVREGPVCYRSKTESAARTGKRGQC